MKESQLVAMDATSIAGAIQNKQITSKEVVSTYIAHILKTNPNINAMVEDRFEAALYEANELDQMLARGEVIGPLHGVPISVKESLHVAEMKTTGGLEHRQDLISREDAEVVGRLKKLVP